MGWWWYPDDQKFIEKRKQGVVLYTKPRNEFRKSFVNKIIKRRLETKRVRTHMKK